MILLLLIVVPVLGGLLAWRARGDLSRWISIFSLIIDLALALVIAFQGTHGGAIWDAQLNWAWIPQWGLRFHLGVDGLSIVLILLTIVLGLASVMASWTGIQQKVGLFHLNLLWVLAGIIGVFLSLDLFLFYFLWELMLVPMTALIAFWGHENRRYAAIKFFLFTQVSGLLMLLAILGLYFIHGRQTGSFSFDYFDLLQTKMSSASIWLMLGFFVAFAVKLPVVPLHTWLPDAHTEAPTAGSVILAGLLLKTGGYGMLRFVLPLFPIASARFAPVAMALGVAGILYGSLLAFSQTDLKRLVAYTSVNHLGFVLLGIFAGNELALQGSVIQMLCHGLSTGALFIIAGGIQDRIHTRDIGKMGGFWSIAPRMSSSGMFFALASLGLPGLGNFVGEFLVLLGAFKVSVPLGIVASLGLVFSTIYSLRMVQAVFHGEKPKSLPIGEFSAREMTVMAGMMLALIWIGVYPQPILNVASPSLSEVARVYR